MEILQKQLKCSICNKPLSIPPINYNQSIGSICGRCNTEDNGDLIRQRVFEDIARYLFFPCSYQVFGCTAKLKWGSVEHHENDCNFKNFMCPLSHEYFNKQCSWVDTHNNLAEHIRTKHRKMFCNPPLMKITKKLENRILFWEIAGRVIIVILAYKKTSNMYYCYILGDFTPEHCHLFQCNLSICWDDSIRPLVVVQHEGIKPFDMKNFSEIGENFRIDVDSFKHLFSTLDELTFKFSITKEVNPLKPGLNEKLLSQLECPVCLEYMKPPIFICQTGHNFCEWCSNKIQKCPICQGNLLGGRNFTLEEVTNAIMYPCVYRTYGCNFAASTEKVKEHERLCPFIGRKCFIETCEWKGLHGQLLEHLTDQHLQEMYQCNEIGSYNTDVRNNKYLLIYNNDIFLLKISYEAKQQFQFAVLRYEREEKDYNYDLQLMGCSPCINITLSNICQTVPFHQNFMTYDNHTFTSLPSNFIQQFMANFGRIQFKLNISENEV